MAHYKVIEITTLEELDTHINSGKPVIVDFTAVWCGPCQMIGPFFGQLSEQYPDVVFLKVDVDKASAISERCGISCMPTFHVYHKGERIHESSGADKGRLRDMVEAASDLGKEQSDAPAECKA